MPNKPLKIYLADNSLYKTTRQLIKFWQSDDRFELLLDPYWNPVKAELADVIWVEWTEGAIQQASVRKGFFPGVVSDHKLQPDREYDWSKKILVNRMIDIETYFGHFRSVKWENVDHLLYIAKHIFKRVDDEMKFAQNYPNLKTTHFPISIDLDEWTFRKHQPGHNIAWINHNWTGKGLPVMLQALKMLQNRNVTGRPWMLHIVCDWSSEHWYPPYIYHLIEELKLKDNVIFYEKQANLDAFLDGMDYVVSSSYKEAFSLIMAEAMAKGIKSLTHNWIGAKDIWPEKFVWTSIEELVEKLLDTEYNSEEYLELAKVYRKENEFKQFEQLVGLL